MKKHLKALFTVLIAVITAISVPLSASCKAAAATSEAEAYALMIESIVSAVPEDFTDMERAVYIHEFFTANFEYDTSYSYYSGYEFLLYGTGVCQAYAEAYCDIMNAMGIECFIAISRTANHAWNIVNIKGNYYHVDCTWDDPLGQEYGRSRHEYLLISTATLYSRDGDNKRSDWYVSEKTLTCTDTTFEGCNWTDSESAFIYCNDMWYVLSDTAKTLSVTSDLAKTGTAVATINEKWYVAGSSTSYWLGCFSGMFSIGNIIYGNTSDGLWSYNTVTEEVATMQFFDDSTTDVYGCTYLGEGYIIFDVRDEPYSDNRGLYSLYSPLLTTEDFSFSSMLINSRKAVLYPESDLASEPLLDVDDDGKNTVLDLIRIKKYIAESAAEVAAVL